MAITASLRWSDVPWLTVPRRQLASARAEGRMPHAALLLGPAGGGQSTLGLWLSQIALCEARGPTPCGRCPSCVLFLAGNHPDFHAVGLEDKASYIKVDQIREVCGVLAMKSYRGGCKVGYVEPADRMNINANNALLKTLEEPPENTLLILAASRADRLARTVVSRCQRLRVSQPNQEEALVWLAAQDPRPDWADILALAGGAPLKALELAQNGAGDLAAEMASAFDATDRRDFDPLGLADGWSKDRPGERLAWLEYWLETRIRAATVSDAVNNNRDNALPSPAPRSNIRDAFALLDRVREARALLEGSLNTLLLFEDLLVGFAEVLAGGIAARPETRG